MPVLFLPLSSPPEDFELSPHDQSVARAYSGIILNQNAVPEASDHFLSLTDQYYWQTFLLPSDLKRGEDDDALIPPLTGLQLFAGVDEGFATTAALDWRLDHYVTGVGWIPLDEDTSVGAPADGDEVWFNVLFDKPIQVTEDMLTDRYRFGVRGRAASNTTIGDPVDEYTGATVTINGQLLLTNDIAYGPLEEGRVYPFDLSGVPSLLYLEPGTGTVYYSVQQGLNRLWYSAPNPFALSFDRVYESNGSTAVQDDGRDVSLMFRLLAATADEGTDFFGSLYRSMLTTNKADNVSVSTRSLRDKFWLSQPNPSRFGVESLYFDMRDGDSPQVVDRVMIDPLTPDVYFHVYYSNDDAGPGTDPDSWDNLLWTPVANSYRMRSKQTVSLPAPITCKYIKIEFSHLQARYYAPGQFQKPILYKKHPQWVFDYFLSGYIDHLTSDPLIGRRVEVLYDALGLAYQYYDGDIHSQPSGPQYVTIKANPGKGNKKTITVDVNTLARVRTLFRPFLNRPGLLGKHDGLLGIFARKLMRKERDYPIEEIKTPPADTTPVTSPYREDLLVEKSFPVMFFYLRARHAYRVASAMFEQDRAYFVGVKEIAFMRDRYGAISDAPLYIEDAGDNVNVERNDFDQVDFTWVTYSDG